MWKLIVLAVALGQQHSPEFKAGWEKAKARADLLDRYRHGLIDVDTLAREQLKLMTPQEEAAWWEGFRQRMRGYEQREQQNAAKLRRAIEEHERWKAKRIVGPPPPPDMK